MLQSEGGEQRVIRDTLSAAGILLQLAEEEPAAAVQEAARTLAAGALPQTDYRNVRSARYRSTSGQSRCQRLPPLFSISAMKARTH